MTTWTDFVMPGDLERQVTELLNQADRQGMEPEVVLVSTARALCLLAYATRPAGVSSDEVRGAVMRLVWDSLSALGAHPFAAVERAH